MHTGKPRHRGTSHLQSGTLVWEGRAEEGSDDAHHDFSDVLLQDRVCVFPVARVVTGLENSRMLEMRHPNLLQNTEKSTASRTDHQLQDRGKDLEVRIYPRKK